MSELIPRHVRRQLGALRQQEAASAPPSEALPPATPTPPAAGPARLTVAAPAVLPPGWEIETDLGPCLSLRLTPECGHPAYGSWLRQVAADLAGHPAGADRRHEAVYLDLETLALSGAPVFLVGILHGGAEGFHVHQFLARDYSEEPAILEASAPLLASARTLVTYNGLTFDWPYLADRRRFHLLSPLTAPRHLDLLPTARRLYRSRLPDCSLSTVEAHVLGVGRVGDVAGAQIPQVYHDAVAAGDLNLLAPVVFHNLVDLLTLACLAALWRPHLGKMK